MKKVKYTLEQMSAGHFFENFQDDNSFYFKKFFGGLAIYTNGKFVAFLCEKPSVREYRGKKYKIDLWNGCLIPTAYENQRSLLRLFKDSLVHPVIEKWIYLRVGSESFESNMVKLVSMIQKKNDLIGVVPELKTKSVKKRKLIKK